MLEVLGLIVSIAGVIIAYLSYRLSKKKKEKKPPFAHLPISPNLHNQTPPEPNFVGRRDELARIIQWYRDPNIHIGTLVGWGGFGKSAKNRL
jgi:hypothetical protein